MARSPLYRKNAPMNRDVFIDTQTGEWRVYVTHGVMLTSLNKTALEEALDRWDAKDYDEIARRMLKIYLDTPVERSLPILGTVTDDGCVLWNGGD